MVQFSALSKALEDAKVLARTDDSLRVEGRYRGFCVRLSARRDPETGDETLAIEIDAPGSVNLHRDSTFTTLMSGRDLQLGIAEFDQLVRIGQIDERQAFALFDAATRAQVMELLRRGGSFDFGVAKLTLSTVPSVETLREEMQRCIAIAERMSEVKANVTQALQKNAMHEADETFRARCLRLLEAREQLTPEIAKSALRCVLPLCQLVGARFLRDVPVMTRLACEQPSVSRAALEDLIAWKMMPPLEKLLGAFALEHSLEWQKQVLVDVELRGELRHLAQLQTATRNVSRELRGHVARASRAIRDRAPAGAGELSLSEDRAGALSKD